MLISVKKFVGKVAAKAGLVSAGLVGSATLASAALSPTDLTAIQTGISGADVNYFAIGGSILIVMAGIWGFKMVKRLL